MSLRIHITTSGGLESVSDVVSEAEGFLKESGVALDFYGFKLVLHEALNNAIIHGNEGSESLEICCDLEIFDNCLEVTISDEGNGFDVETVLKNSESKDCGLLEEGGRGFSIYDIYNYTYAFLENGQRIQLTKVLEVSK
ncbi:MAG: ATP-binding protein [Lentisphaeraceae bacterium]|nr:ATP-binding protein [Lentisphaeraceae bacterium]